MVVMVVLVVEVGMVVVVVVGTILVFVPRFSVPPLYNHHYVAYISHTNK